MSIFRCGKYMLDLSKKTYVMGILNLTPDSFSDGGDFNTLELALKRAKEIENEGADIIDIGAQSTRPGYIKISEEEELKRLAPALKEICKSVKIPVSIDTFYSSVAYEALNLGASVINDVTGFKDNNMFEVVKGSDCGCIIMHDMPGLNIKSFFNAQLNKAERFGIDKQRLCFDPGIGFGKSYEENLYILKNPYEFKIEDIAILIGASRKRVIGMSCGNPPFKERLCGTIAAHVLAVAGGANIVRVHDVKETVQAVKVADSILRENEMN